MQNKYKTKKLEMGRMAGDLEKKKGLSKLLAAAARLTICRDLRRLNLRSGGTGRIGVRILDAIYATQR